MTKPRIAKTRATKTPAVKRGSAKQPAHKPKPSPRRRSKRHAEWNIGARIWIEHDGQVVLGKGRVALLEAIAAEQSIRQAAARVGMSYRRAWLLVQSMNEAAHEPLVETATGGVRGGGTQVTPAGREAIELYLGLESAIATAAEQFLASR